MKKVTLTGKLREAEGTKSANLLRREKKVPCVLYGDGAVRHFSVEAADLRKLVFTPEVYRVELDLDGGKTMAIIQETQFHPVTDEILHVDFLVLDENKEARVTLVLKLTGQSVGVRNGGKLTQSKRKLRVKGIPSVLPEHLELDVAKLDVGQTIRVRDIDIKGVTIMEPATEVVAMVKIPKKSKEDIAAETTATAAAAPAPAKPKA